MKDGKPEVDIDTPLVWTEDGMVLMNFDGNLCGVDKNAFRQIMTDWFKSEKKGELIGSYTIPKSVVQADSIS